MSFPIKYFLFSPDLLSIGMNPRAIPIAIGTGPAFRGKPRGTCLPAGRFTMHLIPCTPSPSGEGDGG